MQKYRLYHRRYNRNNTVVDQSASTSLNVTKELSKVECCSSNQSLISPSPSTISHVPSSQNLTTKEEQGTPPNQPNNDETFCLQEDIDWSVFEGITTNFPNSSSWATMSYLEDQKIPSWVTEEYRLSHSIVSNQIFHSNGNGEEDTYNNPYQVS